MHQACYLPDVLLEKAEGVGVGHHDSGDVRAEQGFEVLHVHEAVGIGLDHHDFVAAAGCRGGIGAVRAVGNYDLGAGEVSPAKMVFLHQHQAGQLAMGASAGPEGEMLHSRNRRESPVQFGEHLPGALGALFGLERVLAGEFRH